MLEWTGAPCIDTLVIMCGSYIPITIVFIVVVDIINASIICSASASSIIFRYASDVKFDTGIPYLWCP